MDPLTHGIIGLGVFGLRHGPTLSNPACIGAVMGALSPDFDIVTRIKGDYVYLKHHRVETHSIPGIILLSTFITIGLSFFYSAFDYKEVFWWTMMGSLSHILLDLLNSYGASVLYPLTRKKYSLSLLMIYDPVLTLLSLYVIFGGRRTIAEYLILGTIVGGYLLLRGYGRRKMIKRLEGAFREDNIIERVNLMPATFNPFYWDFVVSTSEHNFIGEIDWVTGKMKVLRKLKKIHHYKIEKGLDNELGHYFKSFTPIFHIDMKEKDERTIIKMTDLRYRVKREFKHHASFIYDEQGNLIQSIFHPFREKNKIKIYSTSQRDCLRIENKV